MEMISGKLYIHYTYMYMHMYLLHHVQYIYSLPIIGTMFVPYRGMGVV